MPKSKAKNKYQVHLPEPRLEDLSKEQLVEVIKRYCFRPSAWDIARVVWDLGTQQICQWMDQNMVESQKLTGLGHRAAFLQNMEEWDRIMAVDALVQQYHERWLMDVEKTKAFDEKEWERRQRETREKAVCQS